MNNIFAFDFNSIKVQLKHTVDSGKGERLTDFNSIKVQLKPASMPTTPDTTPFQFHKGTIKTQL